MTASQIPQVIHQTWRDDDVPEYLDRYRRTWTEHHPSWEYRLWTDQANRRLVQDHYPAFLDLYDSYPLAIQRADAARYFILDRHGGIYVDLDVECVRPIEPVLAGHSCVLGTEPRLHALAYGLGNLIGNALMASTARHPLWPAVQKALVQRRGALDASGRPDAVRSTGPVMLTDAAQRFGTDQVTLFPPDVFYPQINATNVHLFAMWSAEPFSEQQRYLKAQRQPTFPPETYAVHHWAGTWTDHRDWNRSVIEDRQRC